MSKLIDAHCHLQARSTSLFCFSNPQSNENYIRIMNVQDERIQDEDALLSLITTAQHLGIEQFVINGCWQDDWQRVLSLSLSHPNTILPQLGLHPWWVGRRSSDWLPRLRQFLIDNPSAGLGECGLDRGPKSPKDTTFEQQLECFQAQLLLAEELRRPVSIHCVRAYGELLECLQRAKLTVPIVLHAWTGSGEMTKRFSKFPNIYFSFGGYITRLVPTKAIEMIRLVPRDKCLVESDSPDGLVILGPTWLEALPGLREIEQEAAKINETHINTPCSVLLTVRLIALARNVPLEEMIAMTHENTCRVFCFDSSNG